MRIDAGKLPRRLEAIHYFLAVATGITILLVMVFMLYEVLMRYVVGSPARWVVDVSEMMMWPITYLAAAYIAQMEGHIRITLVINRLSQKVQRGLHVITSFLALGFSVLVLWQGWVATLGARENNTLTGSAYLPMWQLSTLIGIGAFFLCVQFALSIGRDIAWLRSTGKEKAGKVPSPPTPTEV